MHTLGRTSSRTVGKTYSGTYRKREATRNREEEKSSGTQPCCNAFLKQSISNIAPVSIVSNREFDGYNYITYSNYKYLYKCVANYAKLLKKPFHHNPGSSVGAGIGNLYFELQELVGHEISVNMDLCGKKLEFILWDDYNWGEYDIYFIPIKFVEKLPTQLKRLTISFLNMFIKSTKIDMIDSTDDFECIFEWQSETIDDYENEKERKAYSEFLLGYKEGGRVYKLMRRIEKRN